MAGSNGRSEAKGEDIAEQIAVLRADLDALIETMSEMAGEKAETARRRLLSARDEAGTLASDAARRAGLAAADLRAGAERSVADNPSLAVGIAAAVGFIVGLVTARPRH